MILRRHKTTHWLATACSIALFFATGCSQDSQAPIGVPQRGVYSSEEYDQGRRDGRRDAKDSLFDASGSWMWIWMTSQDYATGYEQGWSEGRTEMRVNREASNSRNTMKLR